MTTQDWKERLESLAAVNYNMYFGSPAERADSIDRNGDKEVWSFEQAFNELEDFISQEKEKSFKAGLERVRGWQSCRRV